MSPIYRIHVDGRGHGRLFKIIKNTLDRRPCLGGVSLSGSQAVSK
jgi:hypothetical protein